MASFSLLDPRSPAVSGLVSLSTFLFILPLAVLQLSLEVFNVAGVLLSQNFDLLSFILQSHREFLHCVCTYTVYIIHVYYTVYIPYFFDQMPRLLFISLLVLCSYYSRAAFISLESPETSTTAGYIYVHVHM